MELFDKIITAIWDKITAIFLYILNLIPAPEFVGDVQSALIQVVDYAAYPAYLTGIDAGLPMLASAYGIRFLIRRLPFIG